MKLLGTLCLTWSLFYAADALQCYTCSESTDNDCRKTVLVNCSANQLCLSATLEEVSVSGNSNQVYKKCVADFICPKTGNTKFSANLGHHGFGVVSVLCCDTDGCNSETLTVPTQQINEQKCVTCDSILQHEHTECNTVQCVGIEDRCFISPSPGCTSANLCDSPSQLSFLGWEGGFFPFLLELLAIYHPNCCEGDLCNFKFTTTTLLPATMPPNVTMPNTTMPNTTMPNNHAATTPWNTTMLQTSAQTSTTLLPATMPLNVSMPNTTMPNTTMLQTSAQTSTTLLPATMPLNVTMPNTTMPNTTMLQTSAQTSTTNSASILYLLLVEYAHTHTHTHTHSLTHCNSIWHII